MWIHGSTFELKNRNIPLTAFFKDNVLLIFWGTTRNVHPVVCVPLEVRAGPDVNLSTTRS